MKKSIAIVGSGPAALMLAASLNEAVYDVTIFEKNSAPARKFLVAGKGGFNLTHSEPTDFFCTRYTPAPFLEPFIRHFTNADLRNWFASIGIPTYVGTSKRVFPERGIKPIQVLDAILQTLKTKHIKFSFSHEWIGWDSAKRLLFLHQGARHTITSDLVVFALGGNSWKITGSDGSWAGLFEQEGIHLVPFQPSNCAFGIKWSDSFLQTCEGKPLKNISIRCGTNIKTGEVAITRFGLEGSGIYALSPQIRDRLSREGFASLDLDLKPDLRVEEIVLRLKNRRANKSVTKLLQDSLNLDKTKIALLKYSLSREEYLDPSVLMTKIKHLTLHVDSLAPIDEAISTVGGIALDEVDEHLGLKKIPNTYVIGEMLDWDAPTGGYLLQACFSMGHSLALHLNNLS
jgi:uncharacterized flavoprotein (TIGR03862 family)